MIQCKMCFTHQGHHHIIVEQGIVTQVGFISADGYWERDLEPDEYAVEYRDELKPDTSEVADWLEPMVYRRSETDGEEEYLS